MGEKVKVGGQGQERRVDSSAAASRVGGCARGLVGSIQDGDGYVNTCSPRPRVPAREFTAAKCTLEEAATAADYVLHKFGKQKDRPLWMWYCRRLGLNRFLDIADEVLSCWQQHEIKYPVRAFQRRLQEAYPKGGAV